MAGTPYDKHFKYLGDLTSLNWIALGQKLGIPVDDFKSAHTKRQIIRLVYDQKKEWIDSWDMDDGKIYFYKFDKEADGEEKVTIMNTSFDEPADPDSYSHKPAIQKNFLTREMFNAIFTEEEKQLIVKRESELQHSDSIDSEPDTSFLFASTKPTVQKPKSAQFQQKLRYDPDCEIDRFLNCVQSYAEANSITSELQLISITTTCLNQSDEGALAVNIVNEEDKRSWNTFKAKLIQILGHSPDYYKLRFRDFKRNGEKLGLVLGMLRKCFVRGWGIEDRPLYDLEKTIIIDRFIESCDKPLSMMLKAERAKLNLDTVLSRACELEAVCCAADTINSVENSTPQSTNQIIDALKKSHQDFMDLQKEFKQELQKLSSRDRPKRRQNPEVFKKLGGLCSFYVKNIDCPRTNCKYRHSGPVSVEQQEVVKNLSTK